MAANDNLSWGKPRIFVKRLDDAGTTEQKKWNEIATPAEDTTEIQTTRGDKVEATIEGGENEGVRNKKNKYALVADIRVKSGNVLPFPIVDGKVGGQWALALQPEDKDAFGIAMHKGTISIEDSFTAADGGKWGLQFNAVKKDQNTNQVDWGVIAVTEASGAISSIKITPIGGTQATEV